MLSKAFLLAVVPTALAGVISRQAPAQCFGGQEPNYDDCPAVIESYFNCADNTTPLQPPNLPNNYNWYNIGNCELQVHWKDRNYRLTASQVCQGGDAITQLCAPLGAGGSYTTNTNAYNIRLVNSRNYVPEARQGTSSSLAKRQQEGDNEYRVSVQLNGVLAEDLRREIIRGSSGTEVTITEEQTVENSLTISSSISGGFPGIVEASIGVDVTQTYTSSSSFGVTVPVNCSPGQTGTIYFIPAYNEWRGQFLPSGDPFTVRQPATNPDGRTQGEYRNECQG